jgi:aspartyl/asparaginyl-tRNA synthetase
MKLPIETFISLTGKLSKLPDNVEKIKSCSITDFEFQVESWNIIGPVYSTPFLISDANSIEKSDDKVSVGNGLKLDARYFDLRCPINWAIFKLRAKMLQTFRNNATELGFMEINSPKLIGTASEGGSAVFPVKYFDTQAYLAQSPQLYKQMAINADFNRVFEVGPVFRAENSLGHRHLCEFTGMDLEMAISPDNDHSQVVQTLWTILVRIFKELQMESDELNYIKSVHNFTPLEYPNKPLIISFVDGVGMLAEAGFVQNPLEDLTTENEKNLGVIIKKKFGSDLFVLDKYPKSARPFYTMINSSDSNYTNSFDVIMRGEEICSGSQRIHDFNLLVSRMSELGIKTEPFTDYLKSFECGSRPHGGCGFGAERILMLFFELGNVRKTSLFPRDPKRLFP